MDGILVSPQLLQIIIGVGLLLIVLGYIVGKHHDD
jgi:hypothetical protein